MPDAISGRMFRNSTLTVAVKDLKNIKKSADERPEKNSVGICDKGGP